MSGKISEPGIYDLMDAEYQGEPATEPSLRSSIAWKMIAKGSTPAHARWEHPKLNPLWEPENRRTFDIGKGAHVLLLGKGARIKLIEGYDYATNEPDKGLKKSEKQEMRDAAYDAGEIPLLIPEVRRVQHMAQAAKQQLTALLDAGTIQYIPFSDPAQNEKTLIWRDKRTGVLCRAMLDALPEDGIDEYKTTGASADPAVWQWRQMRELGFHFRLAFYRRGLEALGLQFSPEVHLYVQETSPPYLLSFIRLDYELIQFADLQVGRAIALWARCLKENRWPGYSLEGYDVGLSEREKNEMHPPDPVSGNRDGHLESSDIAADLKVSNLFPNKRG
jgi:hypothetical protein